MSDVILLSGISGLAFDSPFLPPLLFFCPVLLLFLTCPFSGNGPAPDFFFFFLKTFSNNYLSKVFIYSVC